MTGFQLASQEFTDYTAQVWRNDPVATPADGVMTAEALLNKANLNWDARFAPMFVQQPNGQLTENGCRAITRPAASSEKEYALGHDVVLGVAKSRFRVLQNRTMVTELMQPLVDAGVMSYTAAGALKRGRKAWVMGTLAVGTVRETKDGRRDVIGRNLMALNGHDGRTGVIFNVNDIRGECTNLIASRMRTGLNFRMRHDGRLEMNLKSAYDQMAKLSVDFEAALAQYRFMAAAQIAQRDIAALFQMTFPELKKDDEASPRRVKMVAEMERLMIEGAGQDGDATVWAWFNGVTEYLDHEGTAKKREANFVSSLSGERAKVRERAMEAAMKVARRRA